jgi:hypothetical protein
MDPLFTPDTVMTPEALAQAADRLRAWIETLEAEHASQLEGAE